LTKGKTELRDFSFPKRFTNNRQQELEQQEDRQNRLAEQAYKTQTAENDYLRSSVELDHAYRENDVQDNLLVQVGNSVTSPEPVSFDTESAEPVIDPMNESTESEEPSRFGKKEEVPSYSESDTESTSVSTIVGQEKILPVEEMDDGLLYQQPSSEETEQHRIYQNRENRGDRMEPTETQHKPIPVETEEAKQLAKEMGELRQENYEEVEISEESSYETS
jgi:hypothetical protein